MNRLSLIAPKLSWNLISIAIMTLMGLFLRLYQIGQDNFWQDEVGVASVYKAQNVADMINLVRSHVMAMPLDYFISWGMSMVSTNEGIMRLPAAFWGTGLIILGYIIFKKLAGARVGLITAFFIAVSPILIQYSQELRFYSSLVFFYLLSMLLLILAVDDPTRKNWVNFTLIAIVGVYFHIFILLVLIYPLFALFLTKSRAGLNVYRLRYFVRSTLVILLAFLAGYIVFSGRVSFTNPLLEFDIPIINTIAMGLGWIPFYSTETEFAWIWGFVSFLLEITGILVLVRTNPRSHSSILVYTSVIQFTLIVLADIYKSYFITPRQFLFLQPFLLFFAANGAIWIFDYIIKNLEKFHPFQPIHPKVVLTVLLAIGFIFVIYPSLKNYYRGDKGNVREISEVIAADWVPGDMVLVSIKYEGGFYAFYIENLYAMKNVVSSLWEADWDIISETNQWDRKIFLVTPYNLPDDKRDLLISMGYDLFPMKYSPSRYGRYLWIK